MPLPPDPDELVSVRIVLCVSPQSGIAVHKAYVEQKLEACTVSVETPLAQVFGYTALVERDVERAAQAVARVCQCSTDIALEATRQAAHGNAVFLQSLLRQEIYSFIQPEELVRYFALFHDSNRN